MPVTCPAAVLGTFSVNTGVMVWESKMGTHVIRVLL